MASTGSGGWAENEVTTKGINDMRSDVKRMCLQRDAQARHMDIELQEGLWAQRGNEVSRFPERRGSESPRNPTVLAHQHLEDELTSAKE